MYLTYNESDISILEDINYINNNIDNNNNNYISNIASGIGDILLTKIYNNPKKIYYNIKHTLNYKPYPDNLKSVIFNIILLYKLFKKKNVIIFNHNKIMLKPVLNTNLNIKNYNLFNYFNFKKKYDYKYYIIHTKIRLRKGEGHIVNNIKQFCKNLFSSIKFKYKIIILGEQKIDKNNATKIITDMNTIYDECLLLKNNNEVIDLTVEKMYNTPNFTKFEEDINLIHNAVCNIGFGHGGQLCLNIAFSNYTIYFTSKNLINLNLKKENFFIYDNFNSLNKKLLELC